MGQVELTSVACGEHTPSAGTEDRGLLAILGAAPRPSKPRRSGLTHVLDGGLSLAQLHSMLSAGGPYVDFVKLGWGTACVSGDVRSKVSLCEDHAVKVGPGGTLLELAAARGRVASLANWVRSMQLGFIEVSDGLGRLGPAKQDIIRSLVRDFMVLSEIGLKSPESPVHPRQWADQAELDLEAGAEYVIVEGRESGTVGAYTADGSVRVPLIDELTSRVPVERLIFEAPRPSQQAWFIQNFGPQVNLGNVPPQSVVSLETLRLGLRADTANFLLDSESHQPSTVGEEPPAESDRRSAS
jgi:phosphosulfolactate synthase